MLSHKDYEMIVLLLKVLPKPYLHILLLYFLQFFEYLQILSRANSLIMNNNIRSIILEIKMTEVKLLKYQYFVLFPENML